MATSRFGRRWPKNRFVVRGVGFLDVANPGASVSEIMGACLSGCRVRLRGTLSRLATMRDLSPFVRVGPCGRTLAATGDFCSRLTSPRGVSIGPVSARGTLGAIHQVRSSCRRLDGGHTSLRDQLTTLSRSLQIVHPFEGVGCGVSSVLGFQFVRFHFKEVRGRCCRGFRGCVCRGLSAVFVGYSRSSRCI